VSNGTSPLPNDCWRCMSADECPLADMCRRNSAVPEGAYRSVGMMGTPGSDCADFWPEEAA